LFHQDPTSSTVRSSPTGSSAKPASLKRGRN
jgi:hypothetical protein